MKKYISQLPTVFDGRVNETLIHNSDDDSIQTILYDIFKSLEVNPHIRILDFKFKTYLDEDYNNYIDVKIRDKKYKNYTNVRNIFHSRYGLATITIKIECDEVISSKLGKTTSVHKSHTFDKHLLVPIPDENGMFLINGAKSRLIYQLVDKTMYMTGSEIVIKSLMPIKYHRGMFRVISLENVEYNLPLIELKLFSKYYPVILLYLSDNPNFTLEYLEVSRIMRICKKEDYIANDRGYREVVFLLSYNLYLCVHEDFMSSDNFYVQSIVAMLLAISDRDMTYEDFTNKIYWISKYEPGDIQRSISIYNTIERMLDNTTKRILAIDECYKSSIRSLSKWVLMNFNMLRDHNNLDIKNKRLRAIEALFTELNNKLSDELTRIASGGYKSKFDRYMKLFNFQSNYIRSCIEKSPLLRYDQSVNDMDFMTFFKYTRKGPNALGANNASKTVTDTYRDINSSYVGKIDIISSSKSDPGQSGYLIPFVKLKGMMFDDSIEHNEGAIELAKNIKHSLDKDEDYVIGVSFNSTEEYNANIDNVLKYCEFINSLVDYSDSPKVKDMIDDLTFLNDLELSKIYPQSYDISKEILFNDIKQYAPYR